MNHISDFFPMELSLQTGIKLFWRKTCSELHNCVKVEPSVPGIRKGPPFHTLMTSTSK